MKIIKDERKLKFRGDNYDANGGKAYPFRITGVNRLDATDRQIRINTEELQAGIYFIRLQTDKGISIKKIIKR